MKRCEICGKVSSEVAFDSNRGKYLCLTCRFGSGEFQVKKYRKETRVEGGPAGEGASSPGTASPAGRPAGGFSGPERRKHPRIPILVSLEVYVGGVVSQVFYPAALVNFSRGGVCIEWTHCNECLGYLEGGIHPFCIFSPFNVNTPDSKELTLKVDIDNADIEPVFHGKVAYTLKKNGKEYIGITFTRISPEVLNMLERMCRNP